MSSPRSSLSARYADLTIYSPARLWVLAAEVGEGVPRASRSALHGVRANAAKEIVMAPTTRMAWVVMPASLLQRSLILSTWAKVFVAGDRCDLGLGP
jgi:hypothetical protein